MIVPLAKSSSNSHFKINTLLYCLQLGLAGEPGVCLVKSVMTLEFVFLHFWSVLLRRKEPGSQQSSPCVGSGMGDSTIPVSTPPGLEQEFGEP